MAEPDEGPVWAPVPSLTTFPSDGASVELAPVVCDRRAIVRLLETLLWRSGLTVRACAERCGVDESVIRKYLTGQRPQPSVWWLTRFANACGARVVVELPPRRGAR